MNHASLFTGIGGFDLAAEWMGWENIFQCEKDEWCLKLLNQNFPNTIKHGDIKTTDFIVYRGRIDVLSGGFPCQPYSTAGKRLGKEDERHLWPEMLRAIREIRPRWVVGENVRGLTNWNGGLVFDEVQADLEAEGYEVTPFLLPACAVNAPHRRYRIWFIAYSKSFTERKQADQVDTITEGGETRAVSGSCSESVITNADSNQRSEGGLYEAGFEETVGYIGSSHARNRGNWEDFPTKPGICRGNDGIPNRVDRLKGLGNAVVPQVVLQIFKAINKYENAYQTT